MRNMAGGSVRNADVRNELLLANAAGAHANFTADPAVKVSGQNSSHSGVLRRAGLPASTCLSYHDGLCLPPRTSRTVVRRCQIDELWRRHRARIAADDAPDYALLCLQMTLQQQQSYHRTGGGTQV